MKSEFIWADNVEEAVLPCECETKLVPTEFFEEEWKIDGYDEIIYLDKYVTYKRATTYVAKDESDAVLTK